MSRIPLVHQAPALIEDPALDQAKINGAMTALREQGLAESLAAQERDSTVRAVALQLGYQLPADCTDPDLIQRDISANMRRSVEACLEVGRGLEVLKSACDHGQFLSRLDVLGIDVTVSKRFRQAARKFSNGASTHLLKAIGNQTKLFEMLVLDDEQIEELGTTGQTGTLALDRIATMSVKELRTALRESSAEKNATEKLLADKNAKIDKLSRNIARLTLDEKLLELQKEATAMMNDALGSIRGGVRQAVIALSNPPADAPDQGVFIAGLVGQLQAELNALRTEFNLPDVSTAADQALADEMKQWAN